MFNSLTWSRRLAVQAALQQQTLSLSQCEGLYYFVFRKQIVIPESLNDTDQRIDDKEEVSPRRPNNREPQEH